MPSKMPGLRTLRLGIRPHTETQFSFMGPFVGALVAEGLARGPVTINAYGAYTVNDDLKV